MDTDDLTPHELEELQTLRLDRATPSLTPSRISTSQMDIQDTPPPPKGMRGVPVRPMMPAPQPQVQSVAAPIYYGAPTPWKTYLAYLLAGTGVLVGVYAAYKYFSGWHLPDPDPSLQSYQVKQLFTCTVAKLCYAGFDAWIFEEADTSSATDSQVWWQCRQNTQTTPLTFDEAFLQIDRAPSPPLVSESCAVGVFWMDDIDLRAHETLDGVADAPCGQDNTFIQDLLARAAHRMERLRLADNWVTDADPTTE